MNCIKEINLNFSISVLSDVTFRLAQLVSRWCEEKLKLCYLLASGIVFSCLWKLFINSIFFTQTCIIGGWVSSILNNTVSRIFLNFLVMFKKSYNKLICAVSSSRNRSSRMTLDHYPPIWDRGADRSLVLQHCDTKTVTVDV